MAQIARIEDHEMKLKKGRYVVKRTSPTPQFHPNSTPVMTAFEDITDITPILAEIIQ
jgi:hypothetical protein